MVAVPAGAVSAAMPMSLTALSPQGLPALPPLGWSPVVAFDLRAADATVLNGPVTVVARNVTSVVLVSADAVLVAYRPATHAWVVVSPQVAIDQASATFTIPGAGAYALVLPDVMDPPIAIADVDQPLAGVAMVPLPATATATGVVSPATLPPGGGTAIGALAIQSPTPLPSGTIVQAQVTERYALKCSRFDTIRELTSGCRRCFGLQRRSVRCLHMSTKSECCC